MGQKILVVDDEEEIRRTTKEVLEVEEYKVRTAKSTDAAWGELQEWEADLVLLDIMLPGDLEGFIRKLEEWENVKILYLSAFQKSEAERRGLLKISDKILGYIGKPFSISTLLDKVEKAFKGEKVNNR